MTATVAQEHPEGPAPNAADATAADNAFTARVPYEFARRHLVLGVGPGAHGAEIVHACAGVAPAVLFNLRVALGRDIAVEERDAESVARAVDAAYAARRADNVPEGPRLAADDDGPPVALGGGGDVESALASVVAAADADLLHTAGKGDVVRLVDLLLFEALARRASDVHIQPLADRTLVRYRLDGVLHTVRELPARLAGAVTSRIKVMGRMDVAEQRAPQDGRAAVTVGRAGRRVDLRLSTMPTTYGERVVVRILDTASSSRLLDFGALGMPPAVESAFKTQAGRTTGIVLVTGPTGSGKTTTLYTTLAWVSARRSGAAACGCELNIMTIEDPVEYDLSVEGLAVSQTPVNPRKNVTFATGLRHVLRQDPDVIMVGEVRDEETARIAVQASLTGHLVLSTLHTNDAASAVARLIDLHVEPFLVSSSLSAVLAQRLVRRRHHPCDGRGCDGCLRTGYQGRTGVFELLVLDEALREAVNKSVPASEIRRLALGKGMTTLLRAGLALAAAGVTTHDEVARVIQGFDE
ncbi:MAG TPA: GspE/PulE family protein [Phycisphaerales bacterium]|nr:GspE/PulE family protein [Phycisphaerales bacterium]